MFRNYLKERLLPDAFCLFGGRILDGSSRSAGIASGIDTIKVSDGLETVKCQFNSSYTKMSFPEAGILLVWGKNRSRKVRVLETGGLQVGKRSIISCGIHPSASILASLKSSKLARREVSEIILPWAHPWMSFGDFMTHVLPITCRILKTIPKEKWSDLSIGLAGVSQKSFVMDYLGLLGFDPDQLVDLSLETAEISPHGKAFSANCPPAKNYIAHPADFEAVRNLFSDYIGVGSRFKNRKLYLQRTGKRRFLQESELLPDLRDLGFEIVDLEGMKAKDQIKLFAEAETVIGPHGAGFGNIVFGKNLKVLEWQHPGWIIPCFRNMSAVLGHDYHHLISQQGRLRKRPGQKFSSADIDIPAEAILGELRKAKIT